jgi:hypothetical protein
LWLLLLMVLLSIRYFEDDYSLHLERTTDSWTTMGATDVELLNACLFCAVFVESNRMLCFVWLVHHHGGTTTSILYSHDVCDLNSQLATQKRFVGTFNLNRYYLLLT